MSKFIKYSLISFASLIVLIIIGIILLITLVNPNDYKDEISKQVYKHTGRQLIINGAISWTFYPWLGLQINNVQLNNAPGFDNQPFAAIQEAKFSVRVLPLLHGEFAIGNVALEGLELNLSKDKSGISNWQDLAHANTAKQPANTASSPTKTTDTLPLINISSLTINKAHITWNNQQQNQFIEVNDLTFKSYDIALNRAFPIQLTAQIRTSPTATPIIINLTSKATLDISQQNYLFNNLDLTTQLLNKTYPDGKLTVQIQADINSRFQAQTIAIDNLAITLADAKLTGKLQGTSILDAPVLTGTLQVSKFNPRKLLQAFGKNDFTAIGSDALKTATFTTNIEASSNAVQLSNLRLTVDETNLKGNVAINHFDKPNYIYDLAINQLDLNRYLPPSSTTRQSAISANSATSNSDDLPLTSLRDLRAQGRMQIGKLTFKKFNLTEVMINLDANNGIIKVNPLVAQLYSGRYAGIINIDVRGKTPLITMKHDLTGVQAEPLMQALSETTRVQLSGIANINTQLITAGANAETIKRNLNGNVKFVFSKGILKGIDVEHYISLGLSLIKKQADLVKPDTKQTPFGSLTGTFKVTNGVAQNQDLLLRGDKLQATGQGMADLIREQIDFKLNTTLLNPTTHQPQGFAIPLKISGPFSDVTIKPDMEAILKSQMQKQVDQLKDRVNEQIQKRIGKDLGDKIKQLNLDKLFR